MGLWPNKIFLDQRCILKHIYCNVMSVKYYIFGLSNLHFFAKSLALLSSDFLISFGILVFCRSLRENDGLYVKLERSGIFFFRAMQAQH